MIFLPNICPCPASACIEFIMSVGTYDRGSTVSNKPIEANTKEIVGASRTVDPHILDTIAVTGETAMTTTVTPNEVNLLLRPTEG